MIRNEILITEYDRNELQNLLAVVPWPGRDQRHWEMLAAEVERARVVADHEAPSDLVTMRSRVRVRDLDTGAIATYELVYPWEADISEGRISVLAPIGTALLGYRAGAVIEWPVPGGMRTLRVERVRQRDAKPPATPQHTAVTRRRTADQRLRSQRRPRWAGRPRTPRRLRAA
jgi:regulator of nucleoside diphosphate kinase